MKFLEENLLDHLQRPEFKELQSSLVCKKVSKNDYLCQPDWPENRIFIVSEGRLRVYLGYEDKEFNLGIFTRGDIYSTHTGTYVQALTDAQVLMADVNTFRQKMIGDPEVTKAMVRVLGNILKSSFATIEGLAFKDVNSRLIALLSTVAQKHGVTQDGHVVIDLDLSMEQIARLVGSTRQTVSGLLNDLERLGLIHKMARGKYKIPDLRALNQLGGITEL